MDSSNINFYGEFTSVHDVEVMGALVGTKDLIGAVLRVHFILEEFLNLWCSKVTGCEDFFNLKHFVGFGLKLAISEKLGLPSELVDVFRLFNKIRNNFAHEGKPVISDDQLNSIRYAIDRIAVDKTKNLKGVAFHGHEFYWDTPNVSSIDRLILNYFTFNGKLREVFVKEFKSRNIPLPYSSDIK